MGKAYGSGMSKPTPPIYMDGKVFLVDAVSNLEDRTYPAWVRWSGVNNLNIPQNFILKAWFYPARQSMKLIKLSSTLVGESDYIDVAYERGTNEDYITIRTFDGTQIDKSFGEIVSPRDLCFLWIKHNNGDWDVKIEILENNNLIINWNDKTSNAVYNANTDISYGDETYGSYVASPNVLKSVQNAFNSMIISNGIFDHMTIVDDVTEPYNNVHSDENTPHTLFNCNFNDNINCLLLNAPIIKEPVATFDALESKIIEFSTNELNVVKNRLQIYEVATDTLVYDGVQITYDYEHKIPKETLVNGRQYYARLKVLTRDDAESHWSNIVYFWCYSEPTLTCNIKDGDVLRNSTANFRITYNQAQGEKAKYLVIDLYDENGTLVAKSNKLTNNNTPPVSFSFDAMVKREGKYRATITLETVTNRVVSMEVAFSIDIDAEKEQYLNIEDNCTGHIDVSAYPLVMGMGISNPPEPEYIDHEEVKMVSVISDLDDEINCEWVRWSNVGLTIPQEFILSCWFSPSRIGHKLMKLYSITESDYIEIWFERGATKDYIKVVTHNGAMVTASFNDIVTINDKCFMWLKHSAGAWTLRVERIKRGVPVLISWDEASEKKGSNAELNVSSCIEYKNDTSKGFIPATNINVPLGNTLDSVVIANGIFDHININSNTNTPYSSEIPVESTGSTLMNCAFNDSLSCSDISADNVIFYHSEDTPNWDADTATWVKLFEKPLQAGYNDISFGDLIVKSNIMMHYKAEYYSNSVLIDTKYKEITPKFNRVFISDTTKTFKFESNIIYSNNNKNVQIGQLIPLGSKYPILIQNSMTNYRSGNISMTVMGASFEDTRMLDREEIRAQSEDILEFLTNRKAKVLKDWNGNMFVLRVVNSPSVNYDANYGNGIINIGFDWVEVADYHDLDALRELGLYTM